MFSLNCHTESEKKLIVKKIKGIILQKKKKISVKIVAIKVGSC